MRTWAQHAVECLMAAAFLVPCALPPPRACVFLCGAGVVYVGGGLPLSRLLVSAAQMVSVATRVLLQDAGGEICGISAGAGSADLLVTVQGDGVVQYDVAKEVRAEHLCTLQPQPPHPATRAWRSLAHRSRAVTGRL